MTDSLDRERVLEGNSTDIALVGNSDVSLVSPASTPRVLKHVETLSIKGSISHSNVTVAEVNSTVFAGHNSFTVELVGQVACINGY